MNHLSFILAITIATYLISPQPLPAQTQLPNGGFENWTGVGSNKEEPTNWNSNKNGGGVANLGPQTCFRDNGPLGGSYCLRLETKTYFGTPVNGTATTGKIEAPNTNPLNGYIHTVRSDPDFNTPFTGRPDSLVGYFKYTSVSGDRGKIEVILHGDFDVSSPDQGGSAAHVIGVATFLTPASNIGGWVRFSVPFTYNNANTPAYVLAVATSSAVAGAGEKDSKLWVDAMAAKYNPPCAPTTFTLATTECDSYTSPSGKYTWNATGMYTDTLMNAAGCDSVVTIDLTIQPVNIAVTQVGHVLTASAASATYQWLDCKNGNSVISGETGQAFTASSVGEYAVEVTENACVDTSDCYEVMTVGIEENLLGNGVRIFPNPGSGVVNVEFLNSLSSEGEITFLDLQGRVLSKRKIEGSQTTTFDVSFLADGIYFVRVKVGEKHGIMKWVKG